MFLCQYPAVIATQNLRLTQILATALGTAKDKDLPAQNIAEWEELASRGNLETTRIDRQAPAPSLDDFAALLGLQGKTNDAFEVTELEGPMNLPE